MEGERLIGLMRGGEGVRVWEVVLEGKMAPVAVVIPMLYLFCFSCDTNFMG